MYSVLVTPFVSPVHIWLSGPSVLPVLQLILQTRAPPADPVNVEQMTIYV